MQFFLNVKKTMLKLSCKTRLFVESICLPCYSIEPVQQQHDVPEESLSYALPPCNKLQKKKD